MFPCTQAHVFHLNAKCNRESLPPGTRLRCSLQQKNPQVIWRDSDVIPLLIAVGKLFPRRKVRAQSASELWLLDLSAHLRWLKDPKTTSSWWTAVYPATWSQKTQFRLSFYHWHFETVSTAAVSPSQGAVQLRTEHFNPCSTLLRINVFQQHTVPLPHLQIWGYSK